MNYIPPYWNAFTLYQENSEVTFLGGTWLALLNASQNIDKAPDISPTYWVQTAIGSGLNSVTVSGGLAPNFGPNIQFGSADGSIAVTNATPNQVDMIVNSAGFVNSVVAGSGVDVSSSLNPNVATVSSNLTTTGSGLALTLNTGATPSTIENTGVTSNVAGTGISVSSGTGAVTITNDGVTSAVAGTGISVSSGTGAVTFSNSGVLSVADGTGGGTNSGITIGGSASTPTVATNLTAGTGIAVVNGSGTALSISNAGVTSAVAGSGIGVSSGTGAVTFSNTGVLSVADGTGGGTNSGITIGGSASAPTVATNVTAGTGITITNGAGTARVISNSSPASGISISSGTNISVSGSNPSFSIATTTTPSFTGATITGGLANSLNLTGASGITLASGSITLTSGSEVTGGSIRPTGGIRDASNSLGTSGQVLSSTGSGVSWIANVSSVIYKQGSTTPLTGTPTTYFNTGSVSTTLARAVKIVASLYFTVTSVSGSQITITATLLGGSGGGTTLMTQQLTLPINASVTYASMPISWLDTTAGTNIYKIQLSHTGGVAQPQIIANSNMIVSNGQ